MQFTHLRLTIILCTGFLATATAQVRYLRPFIAGLDSVRTALKIPGMAIALKQGDAVLFKGGLGYADVEHHIKTTAATSFRIASITKTFTSTLVMQLVEQGKLKLESPVSLYGLDFGNPSITVKNLLTHTAEGVPGTHYQYNGYLYGRLGPVLEKVTGVSFYQLLMDKIIKPAGMYSSATGISAYEAFALVKKRKDLLPFFETAFSAIAKPYQLNDNGQVVETQYLDEFGAFGGLVSTVQDLLKYTEAIDRNRFVTASTQQAIFTPNSTSKGELTPYGFGWFTQNYQGLDFYWHYGQTQGESGLLVKVPAKKLSLVVLTNIDKLSTPFPLGDGDLFTSPVGQLLYKYCIAQDSSVEITDPPFYNKELVARAAMAIVHGDTATAKKIYREYGELNFTKAEAMPGGREIVGIRNVGIRQELSVPFILKDSMSLKAVGVGENCSADFSLWCDYGWIQDASGKIVWQMQGQPASHAGGAIKNQKVEQVITLPAGNYTLHYKSDSGHGYNNWDSAPPDYFTWGISLYGLKGDQ